MHAKRALDRVALIGDCKDYDGIANALAEAGYQVSPAGKDACASDAEIVVSISTRPPSGPAIHAGANGEDDSKRATDGHPFVGTKIGSGFGAESLHKMDSIARLAGGIAHDFNNILSVIAICTDEVLDAMEPNDTNRACLEDIRDAVERGSSVTRDLLAFSRRGVWEAKSILLEDLVLSARRTMDRILGADVALETELEARHARVHVDPTQWASVFMNIALNARSAMPRGGALKLSTRCLELDPTTRGRDKPKGSWIEITIADTGCGMTADVQARIFEPFFTTKGMGHGTGLGLSVVYGVIERSGGWIEVESQEGTGTTFRVFVPVHESFVMKAPEVPRPIGAHRQATLLLVEDEDAMRRIALRGLERNGFRVFQAASSEEALALLDEIHTTIDLLITDIVLPGMDGRRLAELLTERDPKLAVLYTSGYTDDEVVRSGVSQSEIHFLQKPYSTKILVQRVEEVLAKTKASSLSI